MKFGTVSGLLDTPCTHALMHTSHRAQVAQTLEHNPLPPGEKQVVPRHGGAPREYCQLGYGQVGAVAWLSTPSGLPTRASPRAVVARYNASSPHPSPWHRPLTLTYTDWLAHVGAPTLTQAKRPRHRFGCHIQRAQPTYSIGPRMFPKAT